MVRGKCKGNYGGFWNEVSILNHAVSDKFEICRRIILPSLTPPWGPPGGMILPDVVGLTFGGYLRSTSSLLVGRSQMIFNHLAPLSSADLL